LDPLFQYAESLAGDIVFGETRSQFFGVGVGIGIEEGYRVEIEYFA
jgi:hypothetical protein